MIPFKGFEELNYFLKRRYGNSLSFLKKVLPESSTILDLGTPNKLSELIGQNGYSVINTGGEDLDDNYANINSYDAELVTAFEIFEHLVAPYNVLKEMKHKKLVATIPLKQWFAGAYWHPTDKWDRHYHEFESKQFDMLLEKSGWKIIYAEKWTAPVRVLGIRPILRLFTPRYYAVYCERI